MQWYFVSTIAALFATLSFMPQILKAFRPKSVTDVSLPIVTHFSVSVSLWALHGFYL